MTMKQKSAIGLLLFVCALSAVPAQEANSGPSFQAGLSASLATEQIGGETFQAVGLLPDFSFGPLGVGIDLTFHFRFYDRPGGDFGFYPRAQDWWDNALSVQQNLDKYLARIAYLRWNKKGDPLYIQLGLLPSTTLGNGFVVGGFSNGTLKPDYRFTGLQLDVDGKLFNFPYVGFESFTSNVSTWDVFGARLYTRPIGMFVPDNAFLKEIQVGFTAAFDTNPYVQFPNSTSKSATGSGTVAVYGVDTIVPLYSSPVFSAAIMGDYVLQGTKSGAQAGIGGKLFSVLSWSFLNRFLGDGFIADYFDRGYLLNRIAQYRIYTGVDSLPGTIGWEASLGASFLDDKLAFGSSLSGPWSSTTGNSALAYPRLKAYAVLKEGVLPVSLEAFYNKNNIRDFNSLISPIDALVGAKIGYTTGGATISLVYDLRYVPETQTWQTTSRLETAVKLF